MLTLKRNYFDPMFHGTEKYHYFSPFVKIVCTDSVIDFAEKFKAYWTLDVIISYIITKAINPADFCFICFDVDNGSAVAYAKKDTVEPDLFRQEIEFTDLTESVKFYLADNVLMFPSDY